MWMPPDATSKPYCKSFKVWNLWFTFRSTSTSSLAGCPGHKSSWMDTQGMDCACVACLLPCCMGGGGKSTRIVSESIERRMPLRFGLHGLHIYSWTNIERCGRAAERSGPSLYFVCIGIKYAVASQVQNNCIGIILITYHFLYEEAVYHSNDGFNIRGVKVSRSLCSISAKSWELMVAGL